MKVLYISDRRTGGIASHVKCLTECLPPEVERYVIGVGGDEPFAGESGHDIRELFQIRRVIKAFKPDVIHFHIPNLFFALYIRLYKLFASTFQPFNLSTFQLFNLVCSWHTPTNGKLTLGKRLFFWLLGKDCYYLPVSSATWAGLRKWLPYVKGEVFFNPIKVEKLKVERLKSLKVEKFEDAQGSKLFNSSTFQPFNFTVGMVGRNADQKDWPSFHKVCDLVKLKSLNVEKLKSCNVEKLKSCDGLDELFNSSTLQPFNLNFLNAGEKEVCNGREAIAKMDLFVMTSKHEQLPTTVLECFLLGTPICGFLPNGGTSDILQFSNGPVRDVFIKERSCEKLADIVMDLMAHPEKRRALVEDGRQILEGNFDAEKNVKGSLVSIYRKLTL